MYDVRDLTKEQLQALKEAYFWQEETQDILGDDITSPEQIPDDVIFQHYNEMVFTDDDFIKREKERIYDKISMILTDYENKENDVDETDLYCLLCEIQNSWELITAQED